MTEPDRNDINDYLAELEHDDTWLDEEEPDADEDQPLYETPDEVSDMFTWFWGDEGGEG